MNTFNRAYNYIKTSLVYMCIKKILDKLFLPRKSFMLYFSSYGGIKSLFLSLYFWISLLLAIVSYFFNFEYIDPEVTKWSWVNSAKSIFPSILGFSLGGYAILIGFGDEKFLNVLRMKDKDEEVSPYMKINASFLHFIFIQFVCLFFASVAEMTHSEYIFPIYFFGNMIFFYAICSVIATAFTVLNVASWFDEMSRIENNDNESMTDDTDHNNES